MIAHNFSETSSETAMEEMSRPRDAYAEQQSKTVAVVILNWNGGEDIQLCVQSVFESSHRSIEVVIVDNSSVDGSSDKIRSRFPEVHFITNPQNLGFAKGSNQGMAWALDKGIRYVLLLNGDARVHPSMIEELLAEAVHQNDSVVACPKMYLGAANDGVNRLWFAYGIVRIWAGLFQNPAHNQADSPRWSEPRDMEFASGCCMLIPGRILNKVGMLDETYFAYCEDIDFSLRVRQAGFRLRYVPSARLWHGSLMPLRRKDGCVYRYLGTRNNLWTVRKHGSWIEVATCFGIQPMRSLYRVTGASVRGEWGVISAEFNGVRDGIFARLNAG